MQFVLMIYHGCQPTLPGNDRWNALSEAEQKEIYADYAAINHNPAISSGLPMGLPAAARTVRIQDGKLHADEGPYQPEAVGGYAVIEASDMSEAITLAAQIPAARLGGAIEVRPVEKYW